MTHTSRQSGREEPGPTFPRDLAVENIISSVCIVPSRFFTIFFTTTA